MSTTIPSRELSIEHRENFRDRMIVVGRTRAIEKGLGNQADELTILDLAPEDVGLTSWATPPTKAGVYATWINCTSPSSVVLCIYKVLQLSMNPTVTSLKFWYGFRTFTVGIHELEACYSGLPIIKNLARALMNPTSKEVLDRLAGRDEVAVSPDLGSPMEAYFSEPYIIDPAFNFEIAVKSREDSPGDYLVLGGYKIERRGMSVMSTEVRSW